jgi:hypothetical protein
MRGTARQLRERRRNERWQVESAATGFCLEHARFGEIIEMTTVDYSRGGIGAIAEVPIEPGTTIAVGFESRSCPAARGTVVRCERDPRGYRVGVRFDDRP